MRMGLAGSQDLDRRGGRSLWGLWKDMKRSGGSRRLHEAGRLRKGHVVVRAVVIGVRGQVEGWMAHGFSAGGRAVRQGRKSQDLDRRGRSLI